MAAIKCWELPGGAMTNDWRSSYLGRKKLVDCSLGLLVNDAISQLLNVSQPSEQWKLKGAEKAGWKIKLGELIGAGLKRLFLKRAQLGNKARGEHCLLHPEMPFGPRKESAIKGGALIGGCK